MARPLWILLFLTVALLAQADDRTCYHLDGSEAPVQRPCTANGVTNCCAPNSLCLTNGLCFFTGQQGLILSRGSCTDKNWGSDCYAPCSKYNRNTGIALVNLGYNFTDTEYCCSNVVADNGSVRCKYDQPFKLAQGTVIPGAGFLENNGVGNSSTSSSPSKIQSSSSCVAVEAGVSVPLGVIAIAATIWAFWERRRRRRVDEKLVENSEEGLVPASRQRRTAELHTAARTGAPIPELMDTGKDYKEVPGSQPGNA